MQLASACTMATLAHRCTCQRPPASAAPFGGRRNALHAAASQRQAAGRRRACVVLAAKKGGGGGKKKGQKGGGGESLIPKAGAARKPYTDTDVVMHNLLLVESFSRKVGRPILPDEPDIADVARLLFEAPFAVLAHDAGEEPAFNYANQAALDLFQGGWDDVIGLPSRQSVGDNAEVEADRNVLLREAEEAGVRADFSAWRTGLQGRRFCMHNATLWNVEAPSGARVGQAVLIPHWEFEDGSRGGPGAPVDEGELAPAEAAVEEQAGVVRQLKEGKGLTNADKEVMSAVAELMARKEKVERIKKAAEAAAAVVPRTPSPAQDGTQEAEQVAA